jgi:hypothetical protein
VAGRTAHLISKAVPVAVRAAHVVSKADLLAEVKQFMKSAAAHFLSRAVDITGGANRSGSQPAVAAAGLKFRAISRAVPVAGRVVHAISRAVPVSGGAVQAVSRAVPFRSSSNSYS